MLVMLHERNLVSALSLAAGAERRLRDETKLPWSADVAQCIHRLLFDVLSCTNHEPGRDEAARASQQAGVGSTAPASSIQIAAIIGGASSGKSTVFNNLAGGRHTSRVTARGHATLGPIAAVHEADRNPIDRLLQDAALFPGFTVVEVALGAETVGEPNSIQIVHHSEAALRGVVLLDMPDFTSEAARAEGDVTLRLMPWFDQVVIVTDSERLFDRQSGPTLRAASDRFGQDRFLLLNRTVDGELPESDRSALEALARRYNSHGRLVLEFRRGRGLPLFPPNTWSELYSFFQKRVDRSSVLLGIVAQAAEATCNQNEERLARLGELTRVLSESAGRLVPTPLEVIRALMTPDEQKHLDIFYRVFRARSMSAWIGDRVVELGRRILPKRTSDSPATRSVDLDQYERSSSWRTYRRTMQFRIRHELFRVARGSRFWNEVRAWTNLSPRPPIEAAPEPSSDGADEDQERFQGVDAASLKEFEMALESWRKKVERECTGLAPHLQGAALIGTVSLLAALVAAPGPVAALTLVTAKGAIASAFSHLAAATGVGALLGRQLARFSEVVQEKLVRSEEWTSVVRASTGLCSAIQQDADRAVEQSTWEARILTLPFDDPLLHALQRIRDAS